VVGLSLELDQISATYLSKAVEILVKSKYAADVNAGKVRKINLTTGCLWFAIGRKK
jgi:hypothetical protein